MSERAPRTSIRFEAVRKSGCDRSDRARATASSCLLPAGAAVPEWLPCRLCIEPELEASSVGSNGPSMGVEQRAPVQARLTPASNPGADHGPSSDGRCWLRLRARLGDHRPYNEPGEGPKLIGMRNELDELMDPEPGGWDLWSPVRAMMTTPVITVTGEATLRTVAELLATEGMGAVVVGGPAGSVRVVTERDLVLALADGADPDAARAADVASQDLITADPEDMVKDVAAVMADYGIRHVPVEVDGKVVGMVSARDILRAVATK